MKTRKQKAKQKNWLSEVMQYAISLIIAIIIGFLLQRYVISQFQISGDSMSPTLHDGDRMIMYRLAELKRFDIAIIQSPDNALDADGHRKLYIKRVIGMPGESLTIKDNKLYINDEEIEQSFLQNIINNHIQTKNYNLVDLLNNIKQMSPELPDENTTLVEKDGKWIIPDGYYFMLGDNRNNSKDSDEFGLVNKKLVEGVAIARFYPFNKMQIAPFQ